MLSSENIVITVYPGRTKDGRPENFEPISIAPGDTISIVGPTGSGKTAFINDIEVFAQGDTVTGRRVLVNGEVPPEEFIRNPACKPIAMITQNTKCLADLTVGEFLSMHVSTRENPLENAVGEAIALANHFTGEKIVESARMSSLSGGQTRSLMIADAVVISDTPILLLDEIENAGIFKDEVITRLKGKNKAVIFVTHDPLRVPPVRPPHRHARRGGQGRPLPRELRDGGPGEDKAYGLRDLRDQGEDPHGRYHRR